MGRLVCLAAAAALILFATGCSARPQPRVSHTSDGMIAAGDQIGGALIGPRRAKAFSRASE